MNKERCKICHLDQESCSYICKTNPFLWGEVHILFGHKQQKVGAVE